MDAVEEIKSRLAIEDVISEYVQLKRAGRNFKGLSPFTSEKTPSFMVSPEKQIWHDFSSSKGGDMFSFVMEVEGLDFKEALELLARRAGIDLTQYRTGRSSGFGKVKDRLYQANELAAKFYQAQLKQNKTALEYIFKKRGFTKDVALAFRLGYSPNTGAALLSFLKKKGFSEAELQQAGLIAKRYRGVVDMFRGRIQIPLMDAQGKVVGFTARLLQDEPNAPKYLNTPQTPLYDKSRHIYGLHLSKEAIRRTGFVVLAEGNLDVIASHQAGAQQVVATAGTALTEMQLKTLGRFTPDVRLAFDQDKAGISATERALPIADKAEVSIRVITIPEGKDPDELIKIDPKLWIKAITSPQDALDWLIEQHTEKAQLDSFLGRKNLINAVKVSISNLESVGEQTRIASKVARLLNYDEESFIKVVIGSKKEPVSKRKTAREKTERNERVKIQEHFLAIMLFQPSLRSYLKSLTIAMLIDTPAQKLTEFLQAKPNFIFQGAQPAELSSLSDYVKILGLQFEELYQDLELLELRNEAARLQVRLIEQYVKTEKQSLIDDLNKASDAETAQLLEKAKRLDSLLQRR